VLVASVGLLVSCGHEDVSSSTFSDGTHWSITDCSTVVGGGALGPRAATPPVAVNRYVVPGRVGHYPIPTTGWHVLRTRSTTVEFGSGKNLLLVTKVANEWAVTDYALCVKHD
jgi:hypothetical protein